MAEVFVAEHRHLAQLRAVKLLLPEIARNPHLVGRLLTEARATARLRHPGIVEIFECDTLPSGGAFIAMAYLQGEPLSHWLTRAGDLRRHLPLAAALVGVVADALGHAHAQSVVHRDVKPENLFLVPTDPEGRQFSVKVLDFGVAKLLGDQPPTRTRSGCVVGTPLYMAPEQWQPSVPVGPRADIYALGCVFYELLFGHPPFAGVDPLDTMRAHLVQPPPHIGEPATQVPPALDALLGRMLAKAPEDRPESMDAVLVVLEAFLGRDRSRFEELLRAPAEHPVARGEPVVGDLPPMIVPPTLARALDVPAALSATHFVTRRDHAALLLAVLAGILTAAAAVGAFALLSGRHRASVSPPAAVAPSAAVAPPAAASL
jgi:serine/threonine protein kinase